MRSPSTGAVQKKGGRLKYYVDDRTITALLLKEESIMDAAGHRSELNETMGLKP